MAEMRRRYRQQHGILQVILQRSSSTPTPTPAMERIIEARKRARGGFLGPLRTGQEADVEPENRWGAMRWWLVANSLII